MKIGNKECAKKSTVRTCNVATQVRRDFVSEGGSDIKHLLKMKIFKLLQLRVADETKPRGRQFQAVSRQK